MNLGTGVRSAFRPPKVRRMPITSTSVGVWRALRVVRGDGQCALDLPGRTVGARPAGLNPIAGREDPALAVGGGSAWHRPRAKPASSIPSPAPTGPAAGWGSRRRGQRSRRLASGSRATSPRWGRPTSLQ